MRIYWSRCGHGHGNFGDKITPLLLKHAGIPVEWAPPEHAELIGVGSVLEKVPETFKGAIWTTGFMHESSRKKFPHARLLGVRGRLTLERIECNARDKVLLGDAGLLADVFHTPATKRHKLGIIPHFADADDPFVKQLAQSSSEITVIDICAETMEVISAAGQCENIISSSLHGLILADSLGIPSRWMELNRGEKRVTGEGFKYRDYYSTFGRDAAPLHLDALSSLDRVLAWVRTPPAMEECKSGLRASIKTIKETLRPLSAEEREARRDAEADWMARRDELLQLAAETIPPHSTIIVADEEQIRGMLSNWRTLPFTERDDQYWGPPSSDEEAIREVERQFQSGVKWIVIAWPMFWMLERFPLFAAYLDNTLSLCCKTRAVRIFVRR